MIAVLSSCSAQARLGTGAATADGMTSSVDKATTSPHEGNARTNVRATARALVRTHKSVHSQPDVVVRAHTLTQKPQQVLASDLVVEQHSGAAACVELS